MPFYEMWEKKTVFLVQAGSLPPGAGGPSPPVDPPQVWPGPRPSHPIMLPGMPGWAQPSPPDVKPPTEPPTGLPDLDSPGFWTLVYYPAGYRTAWIQTALSSAPDHEPKPPKKGTPGEWIKVYSSQVGITYAWLPTKGSKEPDSARSHTRKKQPSSD